MRDNSQYFHVNWIDGMKINKNLFIAQDDAVRNDLFDVASLSLSPIKYGILPSASTGQNTCNINISIDNQNTLRVSILACQAITIGGIPINISSASKIGPVGTDAVPAISYQMPPVSGETAFWIVLVVNPFDRQPAGNVIITETPPRFPFVLPTYELKVISDIHYKQYASHPNALIIGKVLVKGSGFKVEENYIPPSFTVSAHPALVELFSDLETFLNRFEVLCSRIIQKIHIRKQKNDLSEMVLLLCDRTLMTLTQVINNFRFTLSHQSPAFLFEALAGLARLMKNTIDMHIGSGKDILLNYFTEWCDPKQGEMEKILVAMAGERYDHNDVNKNITNVVAFVNFTSELFETLNKLEYIGKKKEGVYVDEKKTGPVEPPKASSKRFSF